MIQAFHSMDVALVSILEQVLRSGEESCPRGLPTRELLGHSFRLTNPRARRIANPARNWRESLAVGEFCWHLSGSDSVGVLAYYAPVWAHFSEDGRRISSSCYGKRLFGGNEPNQWERVRGALAADHASRRAVLTLVETEADLIAAKDVACITSIQFLVRDGRLNCITTMRSCDIIWGLCYDVYFCTMLQELMALELGVDVGWYQHSAASLHLYDTMTSLATNIVSQGTTVEAEPMPPMEEPDALPLLLAAEVALRENRPDAADRINALPSFWRSVAMPLRRLSSRRWQTSTCKLP